MTNNIINTYFFDLIKVAVERQDKLSGINQKLEKEVMQEMKEEIQVGKLK